MFAVLGFLFSLWGFGTVGLMLIAAVGIAVFLHADWKVFAIIGIVAAVYLTEHYVYRAGEAHTQQAWDNAVKAEKSRQKDVIADAAVLQAQLEQARTDLDAAAAQLETQHEADFAAAKFAAPSPGGSCFPPDSPADVDFLHKLIGQY